MTRSDASAVSPVVLTLAATVDSPMTAPRVDADAVVRALLGRLGDGDESALGALYDQVAGWMFAAALARAGSRALAEDAVQEVFVRLAARRGALGQVRHPRAYLLTCLRRVLADLRRRRGEEASLDDELVEPRIDDPAGRADAARLSAALRRLPPKLRAAVSLRYLAELSLREVATVLGVPLFTAASRCRLALARLRRELGVALEGDRP